MNDVKYCIRCGTMISDVNTADWYSHMSIKYCDFCRRESEREKTALRVAALRKRKKQKDKFRDEQLVIIAERNELLRAENELLRKKVMQLREETERGIR
ncbi:MAG: hypothetical protein K2I06_11205 [Ruminococcus sp.]|nr:hypothetical protein [Ruminococcus sp.]